MRELKDLFCLPSEDHAISLLRFFHWNQAKVEEAWFEKQSQIEAEVGLVYDKKLTDKYPDIVNSLAHKNQNICSICFIDFYPQGSFEKPFSLVCGHQYCSFCWSNYLKSKVSEEGVMCVFTKCPQLRCNVVVPHSIFWKFLTMFTDDDKVNFLEKYLQWHCKEFTEENRNIKWCPGKDCGLVVERSDYATKTLVECKCGKVFCFKCGEEDHTPASCVQVVMWKEKEQNDSENLTWIKANTKPCPGCKNFIEKNQGCNHMTCSKCRHEFCWLCLREWKKHGSGTGGYYACNVYD